ncbi:MAG: protease complex subunit PrcB family protein [Flavobacteriaceae bacterium]|nr:protease complex subunit PrcB family protein [Flavobacteriaceae bacterium]
MAKLFLRIGFLILMINIISCRAQKQEIEKEVLCELIEVQSYGGYKLGQYQTITNQFDLKSLYTQLNLTRKPGLPIPEVDFESESIIALFMGEKMTGGYGIKIKSTRRISTSEIEIQIEETKPADMVTMAITSSFSIYKVSIPNAKTSFSK